MHSGLSGRYAQEILPEDTELTDAPGDDSDDNREHEAHQSNMQSLFREPDSVNTAVLKSRALQIRDILSTFSRHNFPTEHIHANIFDRIALLEKPKPVEDCIEQEDLISSIFLLAVNNSAQYDILRHVVPEDTCARHFEQKLQRRIHAQIQMFDDLDTKARGEDPPDHDRVRSEVDTIVTELNHITRVIEDDRKYRRQVEVETAAHLVYLMKEVCCRNFRPGNRYGSRQSSFDHDNSNLFQTLFGREARFGLDTLKIFSSRAIMIQNQELNVVRNLLIHNGISQDYVKEFDKIAGISLS